MKATTPKLQKRKPTLTRAADELGVTRTHLSLVVNGHRISSDLTARYEKWLAKQSK